MTIGVAFAMNTTDSNACHPDFNKMTAGVCKPIFDFFTRSFEIRKILKESGITKQNGYSAFEIFMYLIILPFISKNIYREFVINKNRPIQKDAIYTFLKNPSYNWDSLILKLSSRAFIFIRGLTSKMRLTALVVDDTILEKSRSRFLELLARVFDHVTGRHLRGFRYLTLGWTDGQTFLPLQGRCLSSANASNRIIGVKKVLNSRSNGAKRRQEAQTPAPDVVLRMVKDAVAAGIHATALVFDSWFTTPPLVAAIAQMIPVIGMTKISPNLCYWYNGEKKCAASIYRSLKVRAKKRAVIASISVRFGRDYETAIPVKLLFVRNRNDQGWLTIISTNTKLSDETIIKLYSLRWDIETFHRDIKQFLQFEKGCQSTDYDAISAHCTIVMARYIFLAIEKRRNDDPKTLGLLFHACCEDIKEHNFEEAMNLILNNIIAAAEDAKRNNIDIVEAIKKVCDQTHEEGISAIYYSFTRVQLGLTDGKPASAVGF